MPKELEVLARLTDSKIVVRDVISDWCILTYDIPHNEAGDKARQEFLVKASAVGAMRQNDSVYLMPDSPQSRLLALDLAKTENGVVVVFGNATPLNEKESITEKYDAGLRPILEEIADRLDKIWRYKRLGQQKRALQMVPKTERIMTNVEAAITRRGSVDLAIWLTGLKTQYRQMMGG